MSKFFIDSDDGKQAIVDDEGYEMADADAAREAARHALHDMARDRKELTGHRRLAVSVRDEDGSLIYTATLTFEGRSEPS